MTRQREEIDPNKVPQYQAGSSCSNCMQLKGQQGEEWRPCALFTGNLVNANGWCNVWQLKPV